MSAPSLSSQRPKVVYPESDGQPMADNTLQYKWIVVIKENLERLYRDVLLVFIAADLLWYAVEGDSTISQAADVMVVFGRPKHDRGSYLQWEEDGIAPQVVFEILSPSNRPGAMIRKFQFYDDYGVEEYYIYDPIKNTLDGWLRHEGKLTEIEQPSGWVSPRLKIRFELTADTMRIYYADGRPFLTFLELDQQREDAERRAAAAQQHADQEQLARQEAQQRAEQAQQRAEQAQQRAERLAAQLRALGAEPTE